MDLVVSSASARSGIEAPRVWASNDVVPLYPFETQDIMSIAVPKPTKNTSCESYLCFQDALRVFCWLAHTCLCAVTITNVSRHLCEEVTSFEVGWIS